MKYKEKYERLYKEHCRVCKLLEDARIRAERAEEIARSQVLRDLKQEYRELKKEYDMAWRIGNIRQMLTIISIFAVVLGIIYFCIK